MRSKYKHYIQEVIQEVICMTINRSDEDTLIKEMKVKGYQHEIQGWTAENVVIEFKKIINDTVSYK